MEKQWEVGKTYKLVDVKGFRQDESSEPTNNRIADALEEFDYIFTVVALDGNGQVITTDKLSVQSLDVYVLFNHRDLSRVEVVNSGTFSKDPVVEWLDKYYYVACADASVGKIGSGFNEAYLETDHGDMLGSVEIMEFINTRYYLLQKEAKSNKQKELAEKKAKLLEELSTIDKELEGV